MNDPIRALTSIGQALAAMRFYSEGHPARDRAVHASFAEITDLMREDASPRFTFVDGETMYHRLLLHDLQEWDWARKLEAAGVQRLEFLPGLDLDEYERFLNDVIDRMSGSGEWSAVTRQFAPTHIRYGVVGFRDGAVGPASADYGRTGVSLSLGNDVPE